MAKQKNLAYNKGDLSRKRKKNKSLKLYLYGFSLLVLLVGGLFFFRMASFQVDKVRVIGAGSAESEIKQGSEKLLTGSYLFLVPRSSIFFYPQEEITSFIKSQFPEVASVSASVSPSGLLEIKVLERQESALWCRGNDCYNMDATGFVFSRNVEDKNLIKYHGVISGEPVGQTYGKDGLLPHLRELVGKLSDIGIEARSVSVIDQADVEIYFSDSSGSSVIKFLLKDISDSQILDNVSLFLGRLKAGNAGTLPNFEYIDARYGNKIFYKLKGK